MSCDQCFEDTGATIGPSVPRTMAAGSPLFALGQVVSTPGAIDAMAPYQGLSMKLLARHVRGDWGEVCAEDAAENDLSVREGFRILSAYDTPGDERIWLITEADRSATTFLLPDEY